MHTTSVYGNARLKRIDVERIRHELEAAILAFMEDDEEETKHAEGTKSKLS